MAVFLFGDLKMFVRVKTDIMVGNKTVKKGHTAETSKSEGAELLAKGYAEEVESLDAVDSATDELNVEKMTVAELKTWLKDNEVEFKSDMKSDELKQLVKNQIESSK